MARILSSNLIQVNRPEGSLIADWWALSPLRATSPIDDLISSIQRLCDLPHGALSEEQTAALDFLDFIGVTRRTDGYTAVRPAQINGDPDVAEAHEKNEIHLLMSNTCNISCVYCLNGTETYKNDAGIRMDSSDATEFIRWLQGKFSPRKRTMVCFFGGEPMIAWKDIIRVIDYCEEAFSDVEFYMTSNLTILPTQFLAACRGRKITIDVTIDGPRHVHDQTRAWHRTSSFDETTRNVDRLTSSDVRVVSKMILTKYNQSYINETIDIHRSLGVFSSSLTQLRSSDLDGKTFNFLASPDVVRDEVSLATRRYIAGEISFDPASTIDAMLQSGERYEQYCGAGSDHSLTVDNDGKVYNCAWSVGSTKYQTGQIKAGSVKIFADVDAKFRRDAAIGNNNGCAECSYRYVCGGPCPATRLHVEGEAGEALFQAERRVKCAVTRPIVEELLWHHSQTEAV